MGSHASPRPESPLSREALAHVEVGHTDVSRATARAIVAGFLVLLALLPLGEWIGGRLVTGETGVTGAWGRLVRLPGDMRARVATLDPSTASAWDRIVEANRAVLAGFTAFEAALEDRSPVGTLLRPPAQLALSRWLGAGNEQVYLGRDGWLFFRPDVEYVTGRGVIEPDAVARRLRATGEHAEPPAADPRPAILAFARDLEARGIALVLVPTPVKPTVHPGELTRRLAGARAPVQNASYDALVADLRRQGVRVFDPAPLLVQWRLEGGSPQYLATDTHWRPEAMERVAAELAAWLQREVPLPGVPDPGYRTVARQARARGDTLVALDLPDGQAAYPPETVPLRFVIDATGDPWRPTRGADVLLLGDSFTNIFSLATMGWGEAAGFAEHLSLALRRPVDRLVQNDAGARATRDLLARETTGGGGPDRLTGTRIVVWQFATRELASGDWAVLPLGR